DVIGRFEETSPEEIDRMLDAADAAFRAWRRSSFAERGACLRDVADRLRAAKGEHARTMALEMGNPAVEGEPEMGECASAGAYYAEPAEQMLAPQPRTTDAAESWVRFDPLGPVLAVMPWNFPFWQVFRFAAPALMAGNAAVLKHASNVSRCALE